MAGNQTKDVQNGILTYYNNNIITKQFNLYEIKDSLDNKPLFEVKERRVNIDTSQDFNTIVDGIQ